MVYLAARKVDKYNSVRQKTLRENTLIVRSFYHVEPKLSELSRRDSRQLNRGRKSR